MFSTLSISTWESYRYNRNDFSQRFATLYEFTRALERNGYFGMALESANYFLRHAKCRQSIFQCGIYSDPRIKDLFEIDPSNMTIAFAFAMQNLQSGNIIRARQLLSRVARSRYEVSIMAREELNILDSENA